MTLNNKTYDVIKWIAQYFIPAAGTLYAALSKIWGFPYGSEVVGTLSAIDIFLGAVLGISSSNYNGEGTLEIHSDPEADKDVYQLMLNVPAESLADRDSVTFKVSKPSQE
jgi:hypothetical protein